MIENELLFFPFLALALACPTLCLSAQDEVEAEQLRKQFEEKAEESQALLAELRTKADNSADPLLVWQDATRIDNPFIKNEAIRQMCIHLDPRSLPVLDELSRQSAPRPPYRLEDGIFHYPSYAARVAERLRSKIAFEGELQRTAPDKQVKFAANAIRARRDQYVEEFALTWLLHQPASEEVIDALLQRPAYARVCSYLCVVDEQFLPILCDRLERTNDGDVAHGLATVLSKRHDRRCLPSLINSITHDFDVGNKLAGAAIARAIGEFGDEILPPIEKVWKDTDSASIRKRLAIAAKICSTRASSALLVKWREGIRAEVLELQKNNETKTAVFSDKRELLTQLRLFVDDLRDKGIQP